MGKKYRVKYVTQVSYNGRERITSQVPIYEEVDDDELVQGETYFEKKGVQASRYAGGKDTQYTEYIYTPVGGGAEPKSYVTKVERKSNYNDDDSPEMGIVQHSYGNEDTEMGIVQHSNAKTYDDTEMGIVQHGNADSYQDTINKLKEQKAEEEREQAARLEYINTHMYDAIHDEDYDDIVEEYNAYENQKHKEVDDQIAAYETLYNRASNVDELKKRSNEAADQAVEYYNCRQDEDYAWKSGMGSMQVMEGQDEERDKYINNIDDTRDRVQAEGGGFHSEDNYYKYSLMEPEEVSMYNYLKYEKGNDAAKDYLSYIDNKLSVRAAYGLKEESKDSWFQQGMIGARAGLEDTVQNISQVFTNEIVDPTGNQYAADLIAEDLQGMGKVLFGITRTGAALAPSILLSAVTGGFGATGLVAQAAGSVITGLSTAGQAQNQAMRQGYSVAQARTYGLALGATQAILQTMLGGALKGATPEFAERAAVGLTRVEQVVQKVALKSPVLATVLNGVIDVGKRGLEQGAVGYLSTALEPAIRNACFNENNEFNPFFDEKALKAGLEQGLAAMVIAVPGAAMQAKGNYQYFKGLEMENSALSAAGTAGGNAGPEEPNGLIGRGETLEAEGVPMKTASTPEQVELAAANVAETLNDPRLAKTFIDGYDGNMPLSEYTKKFYTMYNEGGNGTTLGNALERNGLAVEGEEVNTGLMRAHMAGENTGESKYKIPYTKSRPSFAKNQVDDVWKYGGEATGGKVYDPSGVEIIWDRSKPRKGQWDMGHVPGQKYSDVHKLYLEGKISKKEFLEWYRNPKNYRPELVHSNRSHKYE